MKKISFFLFVTMIISFSSCSQDENTEINQKESDKFATTNFNEPFIISADNPSIPEVVCSSYNDEINLINSNSELWINETNLTKANKSGTISVSGYDKKTIIRDKNAKYRFPYGYLDKRMDTGTTYIGQYCRYRKLIEIPKGYTLILPPPEIMSKYPNMGSIPPPPNNTQIGYGSEFYRTIDNKDQYYLITDVVEISYDLTGRLMFNPPVYIPYNFKESKSMVFKYQYDNIEW